MQHHVHGAHARRALHQLVAGKGLFLQVLELVTCEALVVAGDVVVRGEQKTARATGRVANALGRQRGDAVHHGLDQCTRREVLARAALGVLRVFLQQALIGIALYVGAQNRPGFGANQVHDYAAQLGRVLEFVLRLPKNQAQRAFFLPQLFQRVAVVVKQLVAVFGQQRGPGIGCGHDAGLVVRRLRAFIGHLQEQQVRQLLHIVAIAHAVVAQHVAVVPELLDEGVGGGVHGCLRSSSGRCSLSH